MNRIIQIIVVGSLFLPVTCRAQSAEELLTKTGTHGGLVVHLGCGDGRLTADLALADRYLVHGLDVDPQRVAAARQHIQSLGRYGQVTVETLRGQRLPYVDNLVNLVVAEDPGQVSSDEVMRVLRPGGVAYVRKDGGWQATTKPWPAEIDEWTHFLHGPDNNAVAHDLAVDLPRRMQWLGEPKFARAHEQMASLSACVTAAGRLFYIVDEAPRADVRFPSQWFLVARDAFNGVILWKREIPDWVDQLRRFRSGPAETAFRLAAHEDRVYVTLGIEAPVSILNAITGQTLATCEGTEHARQVMRIGDRLLTLVDTRPQAAEADDSQIRRGEKPAPGLRAVVASDATSGRMLWREEIPSFVHPTLAAWGDRLYSQTSDGLVCRDLATGGERWRAETEFALAGHELGWESPTLVVDEQRVYCADFKTLNAFSAADGKPLWRASVSAGYNSPPDVFLVDGLVWTKGKSMVGMDPATGEVKKEIPAIGGYMHPRCYRNKATDRFFLLGNQGVQFVDMDASDAAINHWIRGTCQYGIMPANGLLYVTPDSCACNMKTKLSGLWALKSGSLPAKGVPPAADTRLVQGPAFGQVESTAADDSSWPVYRHDFARSGLTTASVASKLSPAWQAEIGGKLSGVTVAGGKLFVASVDAGIVHALDQQTGSPLWTFTASGRIDSPPTIYEGLALFGSADGYVYALRAADGELAWRFRAAPEDLRTYVNGRLESVWPVHGSLVIHQGALIVPAGRSSYLDGGIRLMQLDPQTGRLLSETVVYSPDPETARQPADDANTKDVRGLLSDIVVSDGKDVFMMHARLDLETGSDTGSGVHMFCPVGLLDDSWWHRGYWVFHDQFIAHWSGWWKVGNLVPSGRILSYDQGSIFGYGRDKYPSGNTGQWRGGERYRLFACDRPSPDQALNAPEPKPAAKKAARRTKPAKQEPAASKQNRWESQVPFYVRAMVVARDTIFIAGPPEKTETQGSGEASLLLADPQEAVAAWNGQRGGMLWAVSAADGQRQAAYELDAPPIFDGMAATEDRLYLATTDGRVICLAD